MSTVQLMNLSRELHQLSFSFLDLPDLVRVSQVCSEWRESSSALFLLNNYKAPIKSSLLFHHFLLLHPHNIKVLSIRTSQVQNKSLNLFAKRFKELAELNLDYCPKITGHGLEKLDRLQSLTKISFQGASFSSFQIHQFIRKHPNLTSIQLSGCLRVTWLNFQKGLLPSLKDLSLSGCTHLSEKSLTKMLKTTPQLEQLDLCQTPGVKSKVATVIATSLTSLRTLSLRGCNSLKDPDIHEIFTHCTNLTGIDLSGLMSITDTTLSSISSALTKLDLSDCVQLSNEGIKKLPPSLKNLSFLSLAGCRSIDDEGVFFIANSFQKVTYLDLSGTSVTDEGICRLTRTLFKLMQLNLDGCPSISDRSTKELSSLQHLKHFTLSNPSPEFTDKGLTDLSQLKLCSITLIGCDQITNAGVLSLIKGKSRETLEDIRLDKCKKLTEITRKLIKHLPHLKRTHLCFCKMPLIKKAQTQANGYQYH